jgi:hypothetical protein
MIIAGEAETYQQKVLSSYEIKQFLYKLEALGFYSLESDQKYDPTDKLYDFGNNYQKIADGLWYCILVNADRSRNFCVREPYLQFLIPKMKAILQYLDEYEPAGMTPYYPDRILLDIQVADPGNFTQPPTPIPWDEHLPALDTLNLVGNVYTLNQIRYYVGDMAKEIYLFFEGTVFSDVFSQNGMEFIVYVVVVFPHEKIINPYP